MTSVIAYIINAEEKGRGIVLRRLHIWNPV